MAEGEVKIKILADSKDAERAVDGFESKLKGAMGSVGKLAAKAAAAAAAAIGAFTGMALDAYAEFEQLEGGVQTLFGSSADAVMENASKAFKTAGLSANDYMEQAVGMSAALIQSLGGDTEAAAAAADRAILDMSDNANKMGTDVERIQDAYRGFSRGNFTMLDNLSLGYGGTRSEMERLLADAEAISGVHYDVENYADIVEAIHVVQTEMGITGTTAEEAALTISGSIGMAKAAWENWLTGIADEDADLGALTDQLIKAIETVADNVVPRLGIIAERIMAALPSVVGKVASKIPEVFAQFVGPALDAVSQAINDALGTNLDLSGGLSGMFETLQSTMQGPLEAIQIMFGKLAEALGPFLETWLPMLSNMFTNAVAPAIGYAVAIIGDLVALFLLIATSAGEAIQGAISWFQQLPANISAVVSAVTGAISGFVDRVVTFFTVTVPAALSSMVNWFATLPGRVGAFLAGVISSVASFASQMASNARTAASNFVTNLLSTISGLPGRVASIGGDIVRGIARGITGAAGSVASALSGVVNSAINGIKARLGIASPSKVFAREVGQWIPKGAAAGVLAAADSFYDAVNEVMGYVPEAPAMALSGADMATAASAMGGLTVMVDGLAVNDTAGIRDTVIDFAYALAGRV